MRHNVLRRLVPQFFIYVGEKEDYPRLSNSYHSLQESGILTSLCIVPFEKLMIQKLEQFCTSCYIRIASQFPRPYSWQFYRNSGPCCLEISSGFAEAVCAVGDLSPTERSTVDVADIIHPAEDPWFCPLLTLNVRNGSNSVRFYIC